MSEGLERWAHYTARASWLVSFIFLWAGLYTHGWFQTEFHGSSSFNVPAYAKDYEGHYGLFSIVFKVDGESYLASYNAWSKVSDDAFYRIHGAKVAANLAAALAFLTAFSYTRNHISKLDVQVFTTKRMLLFSVLDLILTLIAMITTGLLSGSPKLAVFCDKNGCFPVPQEGMTQNMLGYSWGLWFIRFLALLPQVCAMMYLAWTTTEEMKHDALHDEYDGPSTPSSIFSIPTAPPIGGSHRHSYAEDA